LLYLNPVPILAGETLDIYASMEIGELNEDLEFTMWFGLV
jgi:hypothetical protein